MTNRRDFVNIYPRRSGWYELEYKASGTALGVSAGGARTRRGAERKAKRFLREKTPIECFRVYPDGISEPTETP